MVSPGRERYQYYRAIEARGAEAKGEIPRLISELDDPEAWFVVPDFRPEGRRIGPSQSFSTALLARDALASIGEAAVEPLLEHLERGTRDGKTSAAVALGKIAAAKRLGSHGAEVEQRLAPVLAALGKSISVDDLTAIGPASREATAKVLLHIATGRRAKESHEAMSRRGFAALALAEIGAVSAAPRLIRMLAEEREGLVRAFAANALGRLDRSEAAQRALAERLTEDQDEMVREYASEALETARTPIALRALIAALKDSYENVRLNAAHAFWKTRSEEAVPALIKAARKEREYLTLDYLLLALAAQQAKTALPMIKKLLDDPERKMSHDAARTAIEVIEGRRELEGGFAR